jgi:molybdopterin-guanine dinucleotide biosynthesis protein A
MRNADGDAGIEVVQATAADLNVTATLPTTPTANLASIAAALDVALSTRALESGGNLATIAGDTPALNDDTIKGLLRSVGDSGATPTNATGNTLLKLLTLINAQLANIDPTTGTRIQKSATPSSLQTTVIHTVTASKTFNLTSATFSATSTQDGKQNYLTVRNASDVEQWRIFDTTSVLLETAITNSITFVPPVPIAAGWDITLVSGANSATHAHIAGYEV